VVLYRRGLEAWPLIRFVARFNFVHGRGVAGKECAAGLVDGPRVHELFGVAGDGNDDRWLTRRDRFAERGVATVYNERIGLHQQLDVVHQPAVEDDVALGLARPPNHVDMKGEARRGEGNCGGVNGTAEHEEDIVDLARADERFRGQAGNLREQTAAEDQADALEFVVARRRRQRRGTQNQIAEIAVEEIIAKLDAPKVAADRGRIVLGA